MIKRFSYDKVVDPIEFQRFCWPHVEFYDKQIEVIYSVEDNTWTLVPAANEMGKDFVAGFIALKFFVCAPTAEAPDVRVLTTSVHDDHLRVLWGEIGRWIETSRYPLKVEQGGMLIVKHHELRRLEAPDLKREDKFSYCIGKVCEKPEGMAGHHASHTLGILDESSGISDIVVEQMNGWCKKFLAIGNPNPCNNFFRKGVEAGDLLMSDLEAMGGKAL